MSYLYVKYANILGGQLSKFAVKTVSPYLANFRCPLCGDSKNNLNRRRGYIYTHHKSKNLMFNCHNCNASMKFETFLRQMNHELYEDFARERIMEDQPKEIVSAPKKSVSIIKIPSPLVNLKRLTDLPSTHIANQYIEGRKIPNHRRFVFYYTENFKAWVNTFIPDKFKNTKEPDERIIIPFLNENGDFFGCQGRALDPASKVRYVSVISDNTQRKLFGLERLDEKKLVYITEGPMDSLFFPNALAMCGSEISAIESLNITPDNIVVVYDNEPRSKPIVANMKKAIENGFRIVIWPPDFDEKDVNEMFLKKNFSEESFLRFIQTRTFSGLEAELEFSTWRKI